MTSAPIIHTIAMTATQNPTQHTHIDSRREKKTWSLPLFALQPLILLLLLSL